MRNSEALPRSRWAGVLAAAGATLIVCLGLIAARVIWFDAYWLFRDRPPWLAITEGANRLIDRQTRRAKILQAMTRDYTVALIGSSTIYHGLDPQDVDPEFRGRTFNAGISALIGEELPVVASVVASKRRVTRAVIGLDYFMFSRLDPSVSLNADLVTPTGRWTALIGSVVSRYALTDARINKVAGGEDPGAWTYDGFRVTPGNPPTLTQENDAIRRRTAAPYRPETLKAVDVALDALGGRQTVLYLSPVSEAQRAVLASRGLLQDFAQWREDAAALAKRRGVRFLDLVDVGAAFPFNPADGSNDHWLDNLHYTPAIGRLVLQEVGLRSASRYAEAAPVNADRLEADKMPARSHILAPTPPTKASALKRLKALAASVPREADLVLIGDSLAAAWPDELLRAAIPDKRIFNFGLPGDRVQNTLWRLQTIDLAHLTPEQVLILIGTNNLSDGEEPEAIAAGLARLIKKARGLWAEAALTVVTIPRRGPPPGHLENERSRLNRLITNIVTKMARTSVIDADRVLGMTNSDWSSLHQDLLHLSPEGYRRLTVALAAGGFPKP